MTNVNPNTLRKFENFTSFLDDCGNPLVGRLRFKVGTNNHSVYNSEGTDLGYYVFTDAFGRTVPQVFLEKTQTYSVYFDKYIGESDMATDSDDINWKNIGECHEPNTEETSVTPASSLRTFGTVATMRSYAGQATGEEVTLLGYNTTGDKPAVNYVWDASYNGNDNEGTIIMRSGYVGAWIMKPANGIIDSRDFNVFPSAPDYLGTQASRIINMMNYIESNAGSGAKVYFPRGQYDISGCTIKNAITEKNTQFYVLNGYTATIKASDNNWVVNGWNGDTTVPTAQRMNGTLNIQNDVVLTSTINSTAYSSVVIAPKTSLVLDTNFAYPGTITGVDVYVKTNQSNVLQFSKCNIHYDGVAKFTNTMTFADCVVPAGIFSSDANFTGSTYDSCDFVWDDARSAVLTDFISISKTYGREHTGVKDLTCNALEAFGEIKSNVLFNAMGSGVKTNNIYSNLGAVGFSSNVKIGDSTTNRNLEVTGQATFDKTIFVTGSTEPTEYNYFGNLSKFTALQANAVTVGTAGNNPANEMLAVYGGMRCTNRAKFSKPAMEFINLADIKSNPAYIEYVRTGRQTQGVTNPDLPVFSFVKYMNAMNCQQGDTLFFVGGGNEFNYSSFYVTEIDYQFTNYPSITSEQYKEVLGIVPSMGYIFSGCNIQGQTGIQMRGRALINQQYIAATYMNDHCVSVRSGDNLALNFTNRYIWKYISTP